MYCRTEQHPLYLDVLKKDFVVVYRDVCQCPGGRNIVAGDDRHFPFPHEKLCNGYEDYMPFEQKSEHLSLSDPFTYYRSSSNTFNSFNYIFLLIYTPPLKTLIITNYIYR